MRIKCLTREILIIHKVSSFVLYCQELIIFIDFLNPMLIENGSDNFHAVTTNKGMFLQYLIIYK